MIRAILFDFDGVLVDTEPLHFETWAQVLAPRGIVLTWETYRAEMIGISNREMVARLCRQAGRTYSTSFFTETYGEKKALYCAQVAGRCPIAPETLALIDKLRGIYKLGVVTSSSRSEVEPVLVEQGIRGWLSVLVCEEDVENYKPAPDPYLRACGRLGLPGDACLVVEDSGPGEEAARRAGMEVVRVEGPSQVVDRLGTVLAALHVG